MDEYGAPKGAPEPSFAPADLLTVHEVAALTGLTKGTLDTYRTHRRLGMDRGPEFLTFGRRVLYPRVAVEAYLSTRED